MICEKKKYCFCFIFTYNVIYIILVVCLWSFNHCSFDFLIKKWFLFFSLIFFIIEFVIIFYNLYNDYQKYKSEGAELKKNKEENKIFPFAICEYINSNLNLDNLIEKEIINQGEEQVYKKKLCKKMN